MSIEIATLASSSQINAIPSPAETNTNQKRGELSGGALTLEVIASSPSVLHKTRSGETKGIQQFFTPPAVAAFIKEVLDPSDRFHVLDLTAGDGSLLAPYLPAHRYGMEIDADQIAAAKQGKRPYTALHGDAQRLFPLLRLTGRQFERIVLNPPFGLTWEHDGQRMSSTKAALKMALALLAPGGQGALVGGAKRIREELLTDPALAAAVYAVVDIPEMFPGVSLPCAVLFFASPGFRTFNRRNAPAVEITADISEIADPFGEGETVKAVREVRRMSFYPLSGWDSADAGELESEFRQVQQEHTRRRQQKEGAAAADICLDSRSRLSVHLSALTVKALLAAGKSVVNLQRLDKQRVNYFALNGREWQEVKECAAAELLSLDTGLAAQVQAVLDAAAAMACPVYPIRPQQRLGYLADVDRIECIQSDDKKGFTAGQFYPIKTASRIAQSERKEMKEITSRDGGKETKELTWIRKAKVLGIILLPGGAARPVTLSESKEDIEYLLAHFAVPDPGNLATKFPAEMESRRETLRQVEVKSLAPRGLALKHFQREDIARLLIKQGGILSWEQGGGKTAGAMTFAEAAYQRGETDGNALFIVPQDLIPQWQAEAKKFFGREMVRIKTRAEARSAAKSIKAERDEAKSDPFYDAVPRWYITNYEALSIGGTTGKVTLPKEGGGREAVRTSRGVVTLPPVLVRTVEKKKAVPAGYRFGCWHEAAVETIRIPQTSEMLCPQCFQQNGLVTTGEDKDEAGRNLWSGVSCRQCGYVHKALLLKNMAHELTTAFKQGCIIVDEGTKIKGDSLQSLAVRGLRARRKLVLTGTPVKNIVLDLFHLMGWGLGYNSPRFPFAYGEGWEKFKKDFCVVEYLGGAKGREKILPEVTNLSMLWKMLSGAVVRRRKEDMGEPLVSRKFVPVTVPMGTAQRTQYEKWLYGFADFYCKMHPEADPQVVELSSAILGQLHKMEFTTTLPSADPNRDYFGVLGLSDMTPKTLKVLEIIAFHAARGERILFGSDVMKAGKVIADALNVKGIPAAHILEESKSGTLQTKSPTARAGAVQSFRDGSARVLCAGVQSINLGHNLDFASVVILDGLPWDFATLDQFLARVHRLSSQRPVTVYVIMTEGSLDERKWDILTRKGKSAELTLDGQLAEKEVEAVNLQAVLKELIARGLPAAETIDEADCQRLWDEQAFTLRPIGSTVAENVLPDTLKAPERPLVKPEPVKTETAFTFETILPKTKKARNAPALASMFAPVVQQGSLFAL